MVGRGIRGKKKKNDANFQRKGVPQNYVLTEVDKTNEQLFEYYKRQNLVPEQEWDLFVKCLREELPTSFRLQGCNKEVETLIKLMNDRYFDAIRSCGDKDVDVPQQLPWYPFAYQMNASRTKLRSQPVLKNFHNFLVTEAELGNISRQEAVSMIPPLLLDIKGDHKVLDACAAPGSKTMQIIEMMHADSDMPSGLVVANDVDNTRCYLLVKQALKRMPTPNCVVINEDAVHMPKLMCNKDSPEPILFDRILCDVMCSGDGTFRKNVEMWRSWTPQKAIGLHRLQLNIARRCLQLLAINGLMVYSTCSLNPIEDEAVIAQMLRLSNGAVEVVDVSDRLPQLKRSNGVSSWKVLDKDLVEYKSIDDVPETLRKSISTTFFPPNDEERAKFNLHRCFRILPHTQNTGGFFVAVLRKLRPFPNDSSAPVIYSMPPIKRRRTYKENPFVFLTKDDARWKDIANHYGILDTFRYENLLGRTNEVDKKRTLYFVNDAVKDFLVCNQDTVKFINAGLRMFGRVETKFKQCRFRMSQDGVNLILPYLGKRVVEVDAEDLLKIMVSIKGNEIYSRDELKCSSKLVGIESGSVILVTERNGVRRAVCTWMGARTIAPYISKEERVHVCRMLGYDTSELENAFSSKRQMKAAEGRELASERQTTAQQQNEADAVVESKMNGTTDEGDENSLVESKEEDDSLVESKEDENSLVESKMEENSLVESKGDKNSPVESKGDENSLVESKGQENSLVESKKEENSVVESNEDQKVTNSA